MMRNKWLSMTLLLFSLGLMGCSRTTDSSSQAKGTEARPESEKSQELDGPEKPSVNDPGQPISKELENPVIAEQGQQPTLTDITKLQKPGAKANSEVQTGSGDEESVVLAITT